MIQQALPAEQDMAEHPPTRCDLRLGQPVLFAVEFTTIRQQCGTT
jgi:hypothetical protein